MDLKFSIIIPTLNSHRTLKRCLDSVCCQSYKNWEIIIIDASKNNLCKKICDGYSLGKKLKYIKSIAKKGLAYDRYLGIKIAKGQYISFLDSDDVWKKNKLRNQFKLIKFKNSKFLCSKYILKTNTGTFFNHVDQNSFDLKYLFKNRPISNSAATVESGIMKKISKKYNKNMMAEDLLWWSLILKYYEKKCHVTSHYDVVNYLSVSSRSKMYLKNYFGVYLIYKNYHKLNILIIAYYFICLIKSTLKKNLIKFKYIKF